MSKSWKQQVSGTCLNFRLFALVISDTESASRAGLVGHERL